MRKSKKTNFRANLGPGTRSEAHLTQLNPSANSLYHVKVTLKKSWETDKWFQKYLVSKILAIWLANNIFINIFRTKFLSNMWFLQRAYKKKFPPFPNNKITYSMALYSRKIKKTYFGDNFPQNRANEIISKKSDSATFLYICPNNIMQNFRTNWWANSENLRHGRTDIGMGGRQWFHRTLPVYRPGIQ